MANYIHTSLHIWTVGENRSTWMKPTQTRLSWESNPRSYVCEATVLHQDKRKHTLITSEDLDWFGVYIVLGVLQNNSPAVYGNRPRLDSVFRWLEASAELQACTQHIVAVTILLTTALGPGLGDYGAKLEGEKVWFVAFIFWRHRLQSEAAVRLRVWTLSHLRDVLMNCWQSSGSSAPSSLRRLPRSAVFICAISMPPLRYLQLSRWNISTPVTIWCNTVSAL